MLTEKQIAYLATIPESRMVTVKPFNVRGLLVAEEIMTQIKSVEPNLEVKLLGSLALGIAGAQDIDIYIFCEKQYYSQYVDNLEKILGKKNRVTEYSIKWEFEKDGFHVDIGLNDPNTRFSKNVATVFDRLRNSSELLLEYEKMKTSFNAKSYREYQTAKFEFFNKILNTKF